MYKDPTEFRARFKAYKEGKMPYENGLPKYGNGTPELTSAQLAELDNMFSYFDPLGYDIISIAGMGGNGIQESGLDSNVVSKSGYAGTWLNNKDLQKAIKAMYGNHSKDSQYRYANALVIGDPSITKGKYAPYTALGSGKFKKSGYKTTDEAADAWLKNYERAVIFDANKKIVGYQNQKERRAFAKAAYDYLFKKYGNQSTIATYNPIVEQAVSTAVRNNMPMKQTKSSSKTGSTIRTVKTDRGKIMYFDWGDQQPWQPPELPKIHNLEYPLDNNVPESISSWSGKDSPSKGPILPDLIQQLQQLQLIYNTFLNGFNHYKKSKSLLPPLSSLIPSLSELIQEHNKNYIRNILGIENPLADVFEDFDQPILFHVKNGKLPKCGGGLIPSGGATGRLLFFNWLGLKLRDRMYRTVVPHGYTEDLIHNFISGKSRTIYGDPNVEALYGKYTNLDSIIADVDQWKHPNDVLWRPLSSDEYPDNNDSLRLGKFAVKDLIRELEHNPGSYELMYPTATDSYMNYMFRPHKIGDEDWYHNEQLGWYQAGTKEDSSGVYNSVIDKWDINPFRGSSANDGTIFKYGKYLGLDKLEDIVPFGRPYKIDIRQYMNKYSNGKTPIHIKPANRGKLTRLKARTGKSESELYNDGNPAHKKMVVFARNARKWKH